MVSTISRLGWCLIIGGSGQVAVLVHDQTSRTGIDRRDGFLGQMEAEYPDIEIVDIQYGAGDQLKSTEIATAVIQAHPDLKGYFGANEGSIIGVLNAIIGLYYYMIVLKLPILPISIRRW